MKHTQYQITCFETRRFIGGETLDEYNPIYNVIVTSDGEYIAQCKDETEARLLIKLLNKTKREAIANVSDLLEACEQALSSEIDGSYIAAAKWWDAMKTAVSKTKGKS